MASFYAELHVAGRVYPLRSCSFSFTQATAERGRVAAKVRHGLVEATLDVPDDDVLPDWVSTPHKPLAGHIVFFETKGGAARETLAWAAGQGVGYREEFLSGSTDTGAYVCHLTIAAPALTLTPGGPAAPFVAPAARAHGTPQAFVLPPPVVVTPLVVPLAETLAQAAARLLAAAAAPLALPAALTLGLILASATPAHAPGLPVNPDELRLRELAAKHEAGTLAAEEEAELIALLGKVKGIHVRSLADLDVQGPLRGGFVSLPGFRSIPLAYTKRSTADLDALRRKFNSSRRVNFLKHVAADPAKLQQLKKAGLSDVDIKRIQVGKCPVGYQVHHKLPLDDGGDNGLSNLMFIKNESYHLVVINVQNTLTDDLQPGQTTTIEWPMYDGLIYPVTPQP